MASHSISNEPHALYRFYSDSGQLLYVGITNNPGNRFSQHQAGKPWWHEVAGISVEKHPSRNAALAAEARAIEVEHPLHNRSRPSLPSKRRGRRAATPRAVRSLVWKCDVCDLPVEGKSGYIHVNEADVGRHQRKQMAVESRVRARSAAEGHELDIWSGSDLMDLPLPVPWQVHHHECDPDPESPDYWFEVGRARTHAHLLNWTAHLMGKSWIDATNWSEFIRAAAGVEA